MSYYYPPGTDTSAKSCRVTLECDRCGYEWSADGTEELGARFALDDDEPCPRCARLMKAAILAVCEECGEYFIADCYRDFEDATFLVWRDGKSYCRVEDQGPPCPDCGSDGLIMRPEERRAQAGT